jgi:hypothetical protein
MQYFYTATYDVAIGSWTRCRVLLSDQIAITAWASPFVRYRQPRTDADQESPQDAPFVEFAARLAEAE